MYILFDIDVALQFRYFVRKNTPYSWANNKLSLERFCHNSFGKQTNGSHICISKLVATEEQFLQLFLGFAVLIYGESEAR